MTLDEAAGDVTRQLLEIGLAEGRVPNITGILHAIEPIGDGTASIWLSLDDENANKSTGIIAVHVDMNVVMGISREDILQTLTSGMMIELSDLGETGIMRALTVGTMRLV